MHLFYPKVKPNIVIGHITELSAESLEALKVKGIIFDLDNTLMEPKTGIMTKDVEIWLNHIRTIFKIAVVSNNRNKKYIQHAKDVLQCPTYGSAWKPRRTYLKIAAQDLELPLSELAIVGDRPLTDIWSGQRAGMTTVLVDPLKKGRESAPVAFFRLLERSFVVFPDNAQ